MNTQSDLSDKAMDNADARLKTGYVPPIIVIGEMEFNDAQWVDCQKMLDPRCSSGTKYHLT
jgi:hypothetical protein